PPTPLSAALCVLFKRFATIAQSLNNWRAAPHDMPTKSGVWPRFRSRISCRPAASVKYCVKALFLKSHKAFVVAMGDASRVNCGLAMPGTKHSAKATVSFQESSKKPLSLDFLARSYFYRQLQLQLLLPRRACASYQ